MNGFFQAEDEYYYPLNRIERYTVTYDDDAKPVLKVDIEGRLGAVTVKYRGADTILRSGAQTVPAERGTFLLLLIEDDDKAKRSLQFQPVIAWLIERNSEPVPVTVHGIEAGVTNRYAIRNPNGSISDWGMGDWDNLSDFLSEIGYTDEQIQGALEAERLTMVRRFR